MNAFSGQKSKSNRSLLRGLFAMGAEEGGGKNGGDFRRAGVGGYYG